MAVAFLLMTNELIELAHFNIVGQDRQIRQFHGGVLGELFSMIGAGSALKDDAILPDDDAQVTNAAAEAALDLQFQMFCRSENRLRDTLRVHDVFRLSIQYRRHDLLVLASARR
jgi:hypothetical protein